jgi:hypothetical protein
MAAAFCTKRRVYDIWQTVIADVGMILNSKGFGKAERFAGSKLEITVSKTGC